MAIAPSLSAGSGCSSLGAGHPRIEGQLKIGIGLRRTDRAPLWAARLGPPVAETAVKLDVVYQFNGFKTSGGSGSLLDKWFGWEQALPCAKSQSR